MMYDNHYILAQLRIDDPLQTVKEHFMAWFGVGTKVNAAT